MTELKILHRLLRRADDNILMYSRTTEMLEPKAGCEAEFLEAKEEKEFIQELIDKEDLEIRQNEQLKKFTSPI